MRPLVLLLLASCVVVRVERPPAGACRATATIDAGTLTGVVCSTEAVPGAPTVCLDSRDNVLAPPSSLPPLPSPPTCSMLTITGATGAACLTTVSPFLGGEDKMPPAPPDGGVP